MEGDHAKGTVTPFASMFAAVEAQKAAKRVEEAIAEKQKEADRVKDFIADNFNLINLVSKLPEELHHDIMVPFGKAAFFPGRLIHTNELTVLLGEGYYAERTAKQTVDILKRRGNALDSLVQSLKANIKDLEAEVSFFGTTASEAAEGLVEIREDYVEEDAGKKHSESDDKIAAVESDDYARMMARLDELEEEELAAGVVEGDGENNKCEINNADDIDEENDEDEQSTVDESDNEIDEDQIINVDESKEVGTISEVEQDSDIDEYIEANAKLSHFPNRTFSGAKVGNKTMEVLSNRYHEQLDIKDHSNAFTSSIVENNRNIPRTSLDQAAPSPQQPVQPLRQEFDSSKVIGSIVERSHNLPTTSQEQTRPSSQSFNSPPSRPISRFKMHRRR